MSITANPAITAGDRAAFEVIWIPRVEDLINAHYTDYIADELRPAAQFELDRLWEERPKGAVFPESRDRIDDTIRTLALDGIEADRLRGINDAERSRFYAAIKLIAQARMDDLAAGRYVIAAPGLASLANIAADDLLSPEEWWV